MNGQATFVRADQLQVGMYLPLAHGHVTRIDTDPPAWAPTPWPPYVIVGVDSDGTGSYMAGPWRFMSLNCDLIEVDPTRGTPGE